ncbi:MAG: TusE/DsrC/DsvC family sulfur relay protein [Trueperaceae bacterium]|nr:TusE/DsrC/DsvC family sulfur relay protein [Trueperaceae bacterium]
MTIATIAGQNVHVNEEGFLTEFGEWNESIAAELAKDVGIDELTSDHLAVLRFLREDYQSNGETPTLRRVSTVGGFDTKRLFQLFPKKPAKKMSYVAGVPKPVGCV